MRQNSGIVVYFFNFFFFFPTLACHLFHHCPLCMFLSPSPSPQANLSASCTHRPWLWANRHPSKTSLQARMPFSCAFFFFFFSRVATFVLRDSLTHRGSNSDIFQTQCCVCGQGNTPLGWAQDKLNAGMPRVGAHTHIIIIIVLSNQRKRDKE